MSDAFTTLDVAIFVASLVGVMIVGLIAGRHERTAQDYFLAGRRIRWWGVAGSIFGSNVSANHLVGMMGIGFTVGFAQSHFELGAIAGLMLLCYGFLPVYRKLRLFTLSEYLRQRYDERVAAIYAVFMIVVMVLVQMVNGFYIGSRSLNVLFASDAPTATAVDDVPVDNVPAEIGRPDISFPHYALGIVFLALIAGTYTIFGGLTAVVWTDVIQSVLILIAGVFVAVLVFLQPEIGGWSGMRELDATARQVLPDGEAGTPRIGGEHKMRLYLPSDHPDLPWTGVLSGLMVLHFFYWGTNQFIVQRALGAASDEDARRGIVVAGFLKLLIPFFTIGGGIAAYYLFQQRLPGVSIDSDAAFTEVVKLVVAPGFGIMGLIAAGLIGAILSSVDSMMNSSATIVTFDIYKKYIDPEANDARLIWVGRVSIAVFVVLAALIAALWLDPNSEKHFFLTIVDQQGYLTPGLVVAFFLGMFWRRATAAGAFATMLTGPFFAAALHWAYKLSARPYFDSAGHMVDDAPALFVTFGAQLNMFHRVIANVVFCLLVQIVVSLATRQDEEKGRLTWAELGGHEPGSLGKLLRHLLATLAIFLLLALGLQTGWLSPFQAGILAAACVGGFGIRYAMATASHDNSNQPVRFMAIVWQDRFWAGVLCGVAAFMMYYFY